MSTPSQEPTLLAVMTILTRVETKLDAATNQGMDHEARLRTVEQNGATQGDLDQLRTDVESLKRGRWPLASIGALVGVASLIVMFIEGAPH